MDPQNTDTKSDYFQTPNIDALLSSGLRFCDGYASGAWCTPSRISIQTGRSPAQHIYSTQPDGGERACAQVMSIPRVLKAAHPQYVCAHFGKWHLQYDSVTPSVLGYDVSDGPTTNTEGDPTGAGTSKGAGGKLALPASSDPKVMFSLTTRAGDFIEAQTRAGNPWFAQISHYAVHLDIAYRQETLDQIAPRPVGIKHHVPEYAAMTEDLDHSIGLLMRRLEALQVKDRTYIIFLSDNGGRGTLPVAGRQKTTSSQGMNHPLAASKHSIYEGGLRVPFGISGPGIAPGGVSRVAVAGVDILPTVADLAGYTGPLDPRRDGGSLLPVALGEAQGVTRVRDFLVFTSQSRNEVPRNTPDGRRSAYKSALRTGNYKLIKFYGGAGNGVRELYDLAQDVGEQVNLLATMPERARRMELELDAYLAAVGGLTHDEPAGGKMGRHKKGTDGNAKQENDQ
jgi:arylsulfatase A-like enzyme